MRVLNGLTVGWVDVDIRTAIERDGHVLARYDYWLVTSVDSAWDLTAVNTTQRIVAQCPDCTFLGRGLLIPGLEAPALAERFNLFTGFDEVWFFEHRPTMAKPDELAIVAPLNLESDSVPPLLNSWMHDSRCELGLGGGFGLNYATLKQAVARRIEGLS